MSTNHLAWYLAHEKFQADDDYGERRSSLGAGSEARGRFQSPTRFKRLEEDKGPVSRSGDIQPLIVSPLQEPTVLGERPFKI